MAEDGLDMKYLTSEVIDAARAIGMEANELGFNGEQWFDMVIAIACLPEVGKPA